jgi:t-SNARE complex subunit (syntaxin)
VWAPLQDDVEDDVEHTTSRLLVTTKRIRTLIRKSNNCKLMLCLLLVIVVLIAVLLLVLRVAPAAAG